MTTYDKIKDLLEKLPHRLQVRFAYSCCLDIKDMPKEAQECLRLVELWLKDKSSVTNDELCEAADEAADAGYAGYAGYAAYAAHTANAATNAANTAYAAVNAAAYAAANAVVNTHHYTISYDKTMAKYHHDLILMIKDLTEVERLIYNLEDI